MATPEPQTITQELLVEILLELRALRYAVSLGRPIPKHVLDASLVDRQPAKEPTPTKENP
jgi:hypothetical protein